MAALSSLPSDPALAGPANALVARQPIYNGVLEVFAYELLFRLDTMTGLGAADPDAATARTMLATLVEVGLDALVGDRAGYVNATGRFILDGYAQLAPPARVGFEVLETVEVTDELIEALHQLRGLSYPILLDDFVFSEERRPLLEACDIVKIDVLALSRDQVREQISLVKPFRSVLLAEKVEDYETYEFCRDAGFELFQGYFFCKPRTMSVQEIPVFRLSKLQLMAALTDDDLSVDELERLIERDVGLSYRLLRLVNSSFLHRRGGAHSIRHAAVMLGRRTIRTWASVLALAGVDDRPNELMTVALVRAHVPAARRGHALRRRRRLHRLAALCDRRVPRPAEGAGLREPGRVRRRASRRGRAGRAAGCPAHRRHRIRTRLVRRGRPRVAGGEVAPRLLRRRTELDGRVPRRAQAVRRLIEGRAKR